MKFVCLDLIGITLVSIFSCPSYAYASGAGDIFGGAFIGLIIIIVIFLICREIICWYWKINQRVLLEENILKELKNISSLLNNTSRIEPLRENKIETAIDVEKPSDDDLSKLKELSGDDAVAYAFATSSVWMCVCGTQNPLNVRQCTNCNRYQDYVLKNYQKENIT
jgi:hypothetical protein